MGSLFSKTQVEQETECKLTDEASDSTSKTSIHGMEAVGVSVTGSENSRTTIGNVTLTVIQQNLTGTQGRQEEPTKLSGFEFQVDDPVRTFGGRNAKLNEVKTAFHKQKNKDSHNLVVVSGFGGIGKTQLALSYIKKNREEEFTNVIWIHAQSKRTIERSFEKLQKKLNDESYRCNDHQDVYKYFQEDSIFIFDNSEDIQSIQTFLPQNSKNNSLFLITSRTKSWDTFELIQLDQLDPDEVQEIVQNFLVHEYKIKINEAQIEKIVKKLEPIPLVITIRLAYFYEKVKYFENTKQKFKMEDIIKKLDTTKNIVTKEFPVSLLDPYSKSVFDAVSPTLMNLWNKKDRVSKTAVDILGISTYLYADHIHQDILKAILKIEDADLHNNSLMILEKYSLFKISGDIIQIHRTLQECIQEFCRRKSKLKKYYSRVLPLLLHVDDNYSQHQEMILQNNEYLRLLCSFYEDKKCRALHNVLARNVPCEIVPELLEHVDLIKNPEFLCEAAANERESIMEILLDKQVNFDITDENGFTALHYACDNQYKVPLKLIRVKSLIKNGANINFKNDSGSTVLHTVCELGRNNPEKDEDVFNAVVFLILYGADLTIENVARQTAADLAREYNLKYTFELLDSVRLPGNYLAYIIAKYGKFNLLNYLIDTCNCDISPVDDSGCTILHKLSNLEKQDATNERDILIIVAKLIKWYRINAGVKNKAGERAEDLARRRGHEMLADLLNSEAPAGHLVYKIYATKIEHFPYVSAGVNDVDAKDETGCTLLHRLCDLDTRHGNELELDIVKLAAELVILHSADASLQNEEAQTAADIARHRGRLLLADFLESADFTWNNLLLISVKHKQFTLTKYVWWGYINIKLKWRLYHLKNKRACTVLGELCKLDDSSVSDDDLIRIIDDLDLTQVAEHSKGEYLRAIEDAVRAGRENLANWMRRFDTAAENYSAVLIIHETLYDFHIKVYDGNIYGNVNIDGAHVTYLDNIKVNGNVKVTSGITVFDNVHVDGNVKVYEGIVIFYNATFLGNAKVFGDYNIYGTVKIYGNMKTSGYGRIYNNSTLEIIGSLYLNNLSITSNDEALPFVTPRSFPMVWNSWQ